MDLDKTLRQTLGALAPKSEAFSQYRYYSDFSASGRNKGKYNADDLIAVSNVPSSNLRLERCAYLSLGGADGSEIEYVMDHTEIRYGLLLDFSNEAAGSAQEKAKALAAKGKTLKILIGDISRLIRDGDCRKELVRWREEDRVDGLICSAQAVIHELPSRSQGFDADELWGDVAWDWVPCLIYCREPCRPEGWPKRVKLSIGSPPVSSSVLEAVANMVKDCVGMEAIVHRAGPHHVTLPPELAVELLTKLFYLDDLQHELGEQATRWSGAELVSKIQQALGPPGPRVRVRAETFTTDSFEERYHNYGAEAFDPETNARLSLPQVFVRIRAIRSGLERPRRSAGASQPEPLTSHPTVSPAVQVGRVLNDLRKSINEARFVWTNPVDLVAACTALKTSVEPTVRLGLPAQLDEVARGLLAEEKLRAGSVQYDNRRSELIGTLKKNFEEKNVPKNYPQDKRWSAIRYLLEREELEQRKKDTIEDYLRTQNFGRKPERANRFRDNNPNFCLTYFQTPLDQPNPCVKVGVRQSDYYTYRVMRNCSKVIRKDCGLQKLLDADMVTYLERPQEVVHGGLGFCAVVCCNKGKDKIIAIRKRSYQVANDQDSGKLSSTANEGLKVNDMGGANILKPAEEWVKRGLKREVLGDAIEQLQIRACYLTGALVYLPNLSFNLAFLVVLDCEARDLSHAMLLAPDKGEYVLEPGDLSFIPVPFTLAGLSQYLADTVGSDASKTWDEGALAAVATTLQLAGKL